MVGLLVTRMPQALSGTGPDLPDAITLPDGSQPVAVTFGRGWIAVVTADDRILIFGKDGTLRQELQIESPDTP